MPLVAVPVLAFVAWAGLVFYYLDPIKSGLSLADQVFSALLFVSHLTLLLSWCFAGPITTAILSALSALIVLYLALATKEPWLFLQAMIYGLMYLVMATFLYEVQKKVNDKRLAKERLDEDTHLAKEDLQRQMELEKALNRRMDRFLDLHQFAETLKGIPTVPEVARFIVEESHHLVPQAEECVLYLVDEQIECLIPVASDRSLTSQPPEPDGSPFDQWVMKRSRPLIIEDSQNDFRFATFAKDQMWRLRSVCAAPLMTENKVIGVLRASSRSREAFTTDDLHALDIVSGLGAVTLRNRLLYDRMSTLAIRDTLTGLYLNRYFQERLREEVTRAGLKPTVFSLLILDIDFFKQTNDELGHAAGDLVLKEIAKVLLRLQEPADISARYGGEEFVVLLPSKDKEAAMRVAETIRAEVERTKIVLRRMERFVTVSVGVATYPADARTAEELVQEADRYLYEAKRGGRNKVCGSI